MFLAHENVVHKHHDNHAIHHKLTTLLPPEKHHKLAKCPAKTTFPSPGIFLSAKAKKPASLSSRLSR
jgi:hypothetical protein